MTVIINTPEKMIELGNEIGASLEVGMTLVLTGDLGTGKTTLTKGIASGLGITQMIKSPTYTIIREYEEGRVPLYHMDVYRLADASDDLGLDEYFDGDGICIVEWGSLIKDQLPPDFIEIDLKRTDSLDERIFNIRSNSGKYTNWVKKIEAAVT